MSEPRCPSCDSSTLSVERRPDGDARCAMCGWSGKYAACFGETYKVVIQNPEARIKELEAQLEEAEELLKFYARMHDRDKDGFFERNGAREYLKKWGEK